MIKFSKDFIWKNEAWNLQKTVSGFKFNKNVNNHTDFVKKFSLAFLLEFFRFLRFPRDCPFGGLCLPSMLDVDAICRGWRYFWSSLLVFDAWLCTLFVVAGRTFGGHCFSWMLDFDAICRGRRYFCKSLLAFDAWLWRYMRCSRALGYFIVCLRCLILMLFVVAGSTFRSPCFSSMLAIVCLVKRCMLWLELQLQYLVCLPSMLDFDGCFFMFSSWFLGRIQQMCERNCSIC